MLSARVPDDWPQSIKGCTAGINQVVAKVMSLMTVETPLGTEIEEATNNAMMV